MISKNSLATGAGASGMGIVSKSDRVAFYNNWPASSSFVAELQFASHFEEKSVQSLFPSAVSEVALNANSHISLSHLIDALDSLPYRPDLAFDWSWKALENLATSVLAPGNITDALRSGVTPSVCSFLASSPSAEAQFFRLVESMPAQTSEYLLKKVIEGGPYQPPSSSFGKRLLWANGNPPVQSQSLEALLHKLYTYQYKVAGERRKGASLIRKAVNFQTLTLASNPYTLAKNEVVFFLISGLCYSFRNSRTHANSISPFRSSMADLKTYAHCWFAFLFVYQCLVAVMASLNVLSSSQTVHLDYEKNVDSFLAIFGSVLSK